MKNILKKVTENKVVNKVNIFKKKIVEIDTSIPALRIKDYTKSFGKFTANKNVSFDVGHGVIHGFIGPNGSGKTTTIKTIIGAYTLEKGIVSINGHKPGTEKANSLIGYIPERASFPSHLNTKDYLIAMAELSGVKRKDAKRKAKETLEKLGLWKFARRNPTKFSSGMQKKILLAQALMHDPNILILDEPAANLDPTARKELFNQLKDIRDEGKTILISSHILSELERLVHEVTFLFYGEVLYTGTVDELQKGEDSIFIKTNNNDKVRKLLRENNYTVTGDVKTELMVKDKKRRSTNTILDIIREQEFTVISFRTNDLQTSYDKLIVKAKKEDRGNQSLSGQKVVAQNTGKSEEEEIKSAEVKKDEVTANRTEEIGGDI